MTYNYSAQDNENSAKAVGVGLPISTKQSIEVCKFIRGKKIADVKKILNEAAELKQPIPFTRFTDGAGHKPGMASGKFAPKTCNAILKIVESAEGNAQYKGINTSNLVVAHISAQKGPGQWRYGRKRRQKQKATHIEVIVEERAAEKTADKKTKKAEPKKTESKAPAKKAETKKVEAKAEVKADVKEEAKVVEKKAPAKEAPKAEKVEAFAKEAKEKPKAEAKDAPVKKEIKGTDKK